MFSTEKDLRGEGVVGGGGATQLTEILRVLNVYHLYVCMFL